MGKFCLMLVLLAFLFSCGKAENCPVLRSADPCKAWARPSWQEGTGAVTTQELRNGNASHLLPAEIIYYAVLENTDEDSGILINPVLIIAYLENANLISAGKEEGDFELRLLEACGYGGVSIKKYHGFYPQLVAATYQWKLFQERKISFEEAQKLFPFTSTKKSFRETYAEYARVMNDVIGTSFPLYPLSQGYYQDFSFMVDAKKIQKFFEKTNSPLKEDLFKQFPSINTKVNYLCMLEYCE